MFLAVVWFLTVLIRLRPRQSGGCLGGMHAFCFKSSSSSHFELQFYINLIVFLYMRSRSFAESAYGGMTRETRKKSKFSTPNIDIALMLCTHNKPRCHSVTTQTEWISRLFANTSFSVAVKLMYTLGQPISLAKISCLLCLHIPLSHSSLYN